MYLTYKNLTIRNARASDAEQLAAWWNDGAVMAHAGFPNGLNTTAKEVADKLEKDDDKRRRCIIELDARPIGEMGYGTTDEGAAEIGIKICDFAEQEKGYGRVLLSMFIGELFGPLGYKKVILDTNLNNKRAQHVYEKLGFRKVAVRQNSWADQNGVVQSSVDYELTPDDFVNFAK